MGASSSPTVSVVRTNAAILNRGLQRNGRRNRDDRSRHMKTPRFRIRTLMFVIAALSCVFTVEAARRKRSFCLLRAEFHGRVNEGRWEWSLPDPARGKPIKLTWDVPYVVKNVIMFNDARYHWHELMRHEFSRVASRPWQSLPDESHPPPQGSRRIASSGW